MNKEEMQAWKADPLTKAVLARLKEHQTECKAAALNSVNLSAPNLSETACLVAYHKGKFDMVEEIINLEADSE